MSEPEKLKFDNVRSVRFGLDGFALPVNKTSVKKNTIFAAVVSGLAGTKNKLTPAAAVDNHGFEMTARWRQWTFAANGYIGGGGIRVADNTLQFTTVSNGIYPKKLFVANDRMYAIDMARKRLFHTVDLTEAWTAGAAIEGQIHAPEGYGLILDLMLYKNNLLLVCENGLLTVDKNLNLKHLSDDSGVLTANLGGIAGRVWESDWFSLGYATDTQVLREVFIKTDIALKMRLTSNRTAKTLTVKAATAVQKNKVNLRGDQFKIRLEVPNGNFTISNLSAVIAFGGTK